MNDTHTLNEIAELLALARRPLFITGAGISAASGLPTYRGTGGLYANGLNEEGLPYEDVLSGYMLRTRPELTWRELLRMAQRLAGRAPGVEGLVLARRLRHVEDQRHLVDPDLAGIVGQGRLGRRLGLQTRSSRWRALPPWSLT